MADGFRVCSLTTGWDQPGSRFRWRQYVPTLESRGIVSDEFHIAAGAYPPESRVARPFWLASNLVDVERLVRRANGYDLRFLQRGLISTLCTGELRLDSPLVLDVDDAIFLSQRFGAVDRIAHHADLVICGNEFLARYFSRLAATTVLPTAVDTDRFVPGTRTDAPRVIGWSGTQGNFPYLHAIEPQLAAVLDRFPDVRLRIISNKEPSFSQLDPRRVDFIAWSPEVEVPSLQDLTVGIMPLADGEWERGKCSFKMLTYMAVGIPVVVSKVGMNEEVLSHGRAGLLAASASDWIEALSEILMDGDLGAEMGRIGRGVVETHYAARVVGSRLADILGDVVSESRSRVGRK